MPVPQSSTSSKAATPDTSRLVVVTGSTGYVGSRLVPRLLGAGYRVRIFVRSPDKLDGAPWLDQVDVATGDLSDLDDVRAAFDGADTAFYLVHSMGAGGDFVRKEREMAEGIAQVASEKGLRRMVYLGGLHPSGVELSPHMRSRTTVGDTMLKGDVNAIVLQAGAIIGAGSASFEMIRHLADALPAMPAPRWVGNRSEPISIDDVLTYLVGTVELPDDLNRSFDIGSGEKPRYAEILKTVARIAGLPQRHVFPLPIPASRISGWWVGLVTPIPMSLTVPLVGSLQHESIANETDIADYIPLDGGAMSFEEAVEAAVLGIDDPMRARTWPDVPLDAPAGPHLLPVDPEWAGPLQITDEHAGRIGAPPESLWRVVTSLGGDRGWGRTDVVWALRAGADKLLGATGVGRRRTRAEGAEVGDRVDWWRVEEADAEGEHRTLRLHAVNRLPGEAWLQFDLQPASADDPDSVTAGTNFRQRTVFRPNGSSGRLYWIATLAAHKLVTKAMARDIAKAAHGDESVFSRWSRPVEDVHEDSQSEMTRR